jgi:hypothetical protein
MFHEDRRLGVITTAAVLEGAPILLVSHDEDDGGWQFLCDTTNDPADGRIVHLTHLVRMDGTINEVADLPLGWLAYRTAIGAEWKRKPK